jgi:hypothetical protein
MGFGSLWHIEGNHVEGYPEISADNWAGGIDFEVGASEIRNRQPTPFNVAHVTTQSALEAYELVLKHAGYINRDSQEKRIIEQIKTGIYPYTKDGIVDCVKQVGGWPLLVSKPYPLDSDGDGIPDEWEIANGLDPNDAGDASLISENGYSNIENYINSLITNPIKND